MFIAQAQNKIFILVKESTLEHVRMRLLHIMLPVQQVSS
jgi:hypothetical protein